MILGSLSVEFKLAAVCVCVCVWRVTLPLYGSKSAPYFKLKWIKRNAFFYSFNDTAAAESE